MSDGLFPTGALSVTATTRDVVTNLRRVPVEDLVSLAESVAAAFLARGPLDSISTAALDASGAASQPAAALLSASIGDAVRSHLPKSAIREWWESAGLDSDRADALASTISAAAPSIAATCEREGTVLSSSSLPRFNLQCISRRPFASSLFLTQAFACHNSLMSSGSWTMQFHRNLWEGLAMQCCEWI